MPDARFSKQGVIYGFMYGSIIGVIQGDTRGLEAHVATTSLQCLKTIKPEALPKNLKR